MRSLVIVLACVLPSVAFPCAPPPPTRSELALLTAPDTTLPADGAILVSRHEVIATGPRGDRDEQWKVKDGEGREVALVVESLGSGIERWQPKNAAERDLVISREDGTQVAKLRQSVAKSAVLAAPKAKSVRSTIDLDEIRKASSGPPGGATTLELTQDPPAEAKLLVVAVTGNGAYAHSATAPIAGKRTFEWVSYAQKRCAGGWIESLVVGQHIAITWIDELGRRSAATSLTVTKQRPAKT